MKRYREPELSPEGSAYLAELRALTAEEFHEKRLLEEFSARTADARRRGGELRQRHAEKGTTKP